MSTATKTMLTNEEAIFYSSEEEVEVSSDDEIEVVSPPSAEEDKILSINLRRGIANGVPLT